MMDGLMAGLANRGNGGSQVPVIFKHNTDHAIAVVSDPGVKVMSTPALTQSSTPSSTAGEKYKPAIDKAWQDALLQALFPSVLLMHGSTDEIAPAGGHPCIKSTLSSTSSSSSTWPLPKKHRAKEHISITMPAIVPRPACPQIPQAVMNAQGFSAHHSSAADIFRAGEVAALRVTQPVSSVNAGQTLRVHAEWRLEGVRLWCGMDPSYPASATELAPQLVRCLNEQGVRLLTLVCNGRAIYDAPEVHAPAWQVESRDALQSQQAFPHVQFNPEEFV